MSRTYRRVPHWIKQNSAFNDRIGSSFPSNPRGFTTLSAKLTFEYKHGLVSIPVRDPDDSWDELWGMNGKRAAKKRMSKKARQKSNEILIEEMDMFHAGDHLPDPEPEDDYFEDFDYEYLGLMDDFDDDYDHHNDDFMDDPYDYSYPIWYEDYYY